MAKDFTGRVASTQRAAGITAGLMNDFVHLTGAQTNTQVTDKGGYVLLRVVVNTAPGSGVIQLKCGNDIIGTITTTTFGDISYGLYLYDKLFLSSPDCDLTIVVSKNTKKSAVSVWP